MTATAPTQDFRIIFRDHHNSIIRDKVVSVPSSPKSSSFNSPHLAEQDLDFHFDTATTPVTEGLKEGVGAKGKPYTNKSSPASMTVTSSPSKNHGHGTSLNLKVQAKDQVVAEVDLGKVYCAGVLRVERTLPQGEQEWWEQPYNFQ